MSRVHCSRIRGRQGDEENTFSLPMNTQGHNFALLNINVKPGEQNEVLSPTLALGANLSPPQTRSALAASAITTRSASNSANKVRGALSKTRHLVLLPYLYSTHVSLCLLQVLSL